MLPEHLVTDKIGFWNIVVSFALLVGGYFAFRGALGTATLKILADSNKALKDAYEQQEKRHDKSLKAIGATLTSLEERGRTQEVRIFRLEFDNKRQGLLLLGARMEVQLQEEVIMIAIPLVSRFDVTKEAVDYERMMHAIEQVKKHRREFQSKLDDFDATTTIEMTWLDRHEMEKKGSQPAYTE